MKKRTELTEYFEPEHILVRKAREGVECRLVCLDPEAYRLFFDRANDQMAESPHFEETQNMIAEFIKRGGKVRRIYGSVDPETSFVIADASRASMFCGAWFEPGSSGYHSLALLTEDSELIDFLSQTFELCWKSI